MDFIDEPLPGARDVSKFMSSYSERTKTNEENFFSVLMMQLGQFLDHDIAHTPAPLDGGFFAEGRNQEKLKIKFTRLDLLYMYM